MKTPAQDLKELLTRAPRLTLAAAESLTAGRVQARIASVSGASGYFLGGVTAYSLEEKVKLLSVERVHAERVNCVSAEVAEEMARGVCRLFGADLGVATTGYAEPSPADGVAVPFAWWAVTRCGDGGRFASHHGRIEFPGVNRVEAQERAAHAALAELAAFVHRLRG